MEASAAPDPAQRQPAGGLAALPRVDDLPVAPGGGYDADAVRAAFDALKRHLLQLQAQLRVQQAAAGNGSSEPTGHAVRADALHLIRAASEFADVLERDAQAAAAAQLDRAQQEIRRRERDLAEAEQQIVQKLAAAKAEAAEIRRQAERDAAAALRAGEGRAAQLVEQARHEAAGLTNATRSEVEQTLEWARAQASAIITRAEAARHLVGGPPSGADNPAE